MAIKNLAELRSFFKTGDKPTQQQFWDLLDSFIHKSVGIGLSDVIGLVTALSNKADVSALNAYALLNTIMVRANDTDDLTGISTVNASYVLVKSIGIFGVVENIHIQPGDTVYPSADDSHSWVLLLNDKDNTVNEIPENLNNTFLIKVTDPNTGIEYKVPVSELCKLCGCGDYYYGDGIGEGNMDIYTRNFDLESIGQHDDERGVEFIDVGSSDTISNLYQFNLTNEYTIRINPSDISGVIARIYENDVDKTTEWTFDTDHYFKTFPIGTPVPNIRFSYVYSKIYYTATVGAGLHTISFPFNGRFNAGAGNVEFISGELFDWDAGAGGSININVIPYHTFSTLNLVDKGVTNLNEFNLPDGVIEIFLQNNDIVSFDPSVKLPDSVIRLNLAGNAIVSFDPSIALPTNLLELYLSSQTSIFETFDPSIALPAGLEYVDLSSNHIVTFDPSIALPAALRVLTLSSNSIATFNPSIALPSSLERLQLQSNAIVTFNPTIALPNSIQYLELHNNNIVTFNPSSIPLSLTELYLNGNPIVTFNPSVSFDNGFRLLQLQYCLLTSFAPTNPLPSTVATLNLANNNLNTSAIDSVLGYLDAATFNSGVKTVQITPQDPPASPSGSGLTSKASLETKGWTVNV